MYLVTRQTTGEQECLWTNWSFKFHLYFCQTWYCYHDVTILPTFPSMLSVCMSPQGSYSLPQSDFYLPYMDLPYWLTNGNYRLQGVLGGGGKELGCLKLALAIHSDWTPWAAGTGRPVWHRNTARRSEMETGVAQSCWRDEVSRSREPVSTRFCCWHSILVPRFLFYFLLFVLSRLRRYFLNLLLSIQFYNLQNLRSRKQRGKKSLQSLHTNMENDCDAHIWSQSPAGPKGVPMNFRLWPV